MIISFTPATFAGSTFISTDEGYAAVPPGTYTPTRLRGVIFCPSEIAGSKFNHVFCFCFSWKAVMRRAASRMASSHSGEAAA